MRDVSGALPNVLADRIVSAGTSIGADLAGARTGLSHRANLGKMISARTASGEIGYWLGLAAEAGLLNRADVGPLMEQARELQRALTVLCTKARQALEAEKHV